MVEEFQAAIEALLDKSGHVHFVLSDQNDQIRHFSQSFASICGKKYFDLVNSPLNQLPLFIYVAEGHFMPVAELDFFDQDFPFEKLKDNYFHIKNTQEQVFTLTVLKNQIVIKQEKFNVFLMIDQSVNEELRSSSLIQHKLFEESHEAIVITDPTPIILSVNHAFTKITGYSKKEAIGKKPSFFSSGYHNKQFYEKMWACLLHEDEWTGRIVNRRKNNEIVSEQIAIRAIRNNTGDIVNYVSIFSELSENENESETQKDRPKHRALKVDDLTGLPRRGVFEDRLEQAIAYAKRHNLLVAVYYINLDKFSDINEKFSNQVGDAVIVSIAKAINGHVRDVDTLARTSGDEFALMLRDLSADFSIDDFGQRLLQVICDTETKKIKGANVTASIGVTNFPEEDQSASILLRHASHAMNIAKTEGRNCLIHYPTDKEKQKNQAREAKQAVMTALDKNQLVLHAQPQYNMDSHSIYGIEFLIRWQTEDDELIYPDHFLNTQKDKELLTRVDKWVINSAIDLLTGELQEVVNRRLKVGINLTPSSLQDTNFHFWLKTRLSGVPPEITHLLDIEILENDALEHLEVLRTLMSELEPYGVKFSLDDFGTGYSSLSIFNQLSVQTVKIDRTFVRDMVVDLKNLSLVKAICEMSRIFNREIIAEGVEFKEQADLLNKAGCKIMQGYGIAKPMTPEELIGWLADPNFSDNWE